MNSNMEQVLELYHSLSALQPRYEELYLALEEQYQTCQCFACKVRMISFGMELTSLNSNVSHLEAQLMPSIIGILDKLSVRYEISKGNIVILQ